MAKIACVIPPHAVARAKNFPTLGACKFQERTSSCDFNDPGHHG
jgi:hypothetical protein